MKTHFFYKIKYDLKGHWSLQKVFFVLKNQPFIKYLFCLTFDLNFLHIVKEIESVSLKKTRKKGIIKHKMCALDIQEHIYILIFYTIGEKHHFNLIRSSFVIAVPLPFMSPFNAKHKNTFIWVPWQFWHMLNKTKVFCMIKKHILFFMTSTLFAHILKDIC